MCEEDILLLIERDPWMMAVIAAAARLDLPDWMIGAGFVRNKVWDHLHGITRAVVDTADIDLIYFDPSDVREETEKAHDARLRGWLDVDWSTKNQARMHVVNGHEPYISAADGLAHWVETVACIAVTERDERDGKLMLVAPHGIADLIGLILRPAPAFAQRSHVMLERVARKQWLTKWPKLRIELEPPER